MTTTAIDKPSIFAVFIGEPLDLIKAQPHQVFISTASIALMAAFVNGLDLFSPIVGYLLAGGIEWAYFRGLASDSKAPTKWGGVLNWSACLIVVLWGMLAVGRADGLFDNKSGGWWLVAAHVIPIAWLSLCSAQTHRAAMLLDAQRDEARQIAEREYQEAQRVEDEKLRRWEQAQRIKLDLKLTEKQADAAMHTASPKMRRNALPESTNAEPQTCPKCGALIENRSAWLAARRWNRCASCKGEA
jgi:hypothetical protein